MKENKKAINEKQIMQEFAQIQKARINFQKLPKSQKNFMP